ncbi:MAG: HEAT repeat domain-containing protein, partial [Myxococcales bacterium]
MGIFDLLGGSPEKRIKSCQKKVTEKYGPPENRQKAIDQLIDLGTPEAISALLHRFTVKAEPSITDAEEKDYTYRAILNFREKSVEPLKAFLRRSDVASTWTVKMLRELVPADELVALLAEILQKLGPEYTRDPEKKTVLISTLGDIADERSATAIIPFLEDASDDVRISAAMALAKLKDERAREPLLKAMVDSADRARVVASLAAALAETGFSVQGYREKIEKTLPEGYFIEAG